MANEFLNQFVKVNFKTLDKEHTPVIRTVRGKVSTETEEFLFVEDLGYGKIAINRTEIVSVVFITEKEAGEVH